MVNQRTVDLIVCFMGAMGIGAIAAAVYLVAVHQPVPDPIWGITGGAMVGLPSLLGSVRIGTQGVVVQNPSQDPVLVADAEDEAKAKK